MNFLPILKNAMLTARTAYQAEEINAEQMAAVAKRINGLLKVSRELQRRKEARSKFLARTDRHLALVREGMDSGKRFLAIDTGFDPETEVLQEVGFTVYDNGVYSTATFVVAGQEASRDTSKATAILPLDEIKKLAQALYVDANYVVFHQAHKDIELLGLDTSTTRYFDTSFIGQRWFAEGGSPKLSQLCARYCIDFRAAHHSGADSRMTLEVLFSMATDPVKPVFYLKKGQP